MKKKNEKHITLFEEESESFEKGNEICVYEDGDTNLKVFIKKPAKEVIKKDKRIKKYMVSIPYFHVFHVEAKNKKEAIEEAHNSGEGSITGWDDKGTYVEEEL